MAAFMVVRLTSALRSFPWALVIGRLDSPLILVGLFYAPLFCAWYVNGMYWDPDSDPIHMGVGLNYFSPNGASLRRNSYYSLTHDIGARTIATYGQPLM